MAAMTIRIPDELREEIEKLCKRQHRSAGDVVREALRRYVAQGQLRQTRAKLRPHAEARGIVTDEDVFRIVS
ncbi:MAG TPA: YlcI/YnfO family protein [Phycisphaerae bacterium]|nr:YlcI/YnfO family protein [Phycisphaerae bacterium]